MIKRTFLLLFITVGLLHAGVTVPPGTQTNRDLAYVENGGPDRTLDLYVPEKADGKLPVVVWIHGGAWRSGAKGGWCAAQSLLAKGYAVADINYRLSFKDNAPWPAQINDCKAAVRWLRANAAKYNLDPDHIGVWGHSAGGHLSAMMAVTNNTTKFDGDGGNPGVSSAIQAAVDWSGPSDLVSFLHSSKANAKGMVVQLLGGKDPSAASDDKAKDASPLTYVSKDAAPIVIAHGTIDDVVPIENAEKLDAALRAAGVDCTYTPVEGKGHGIGGPELEKQATDLFDKYLKPGSPPAK